MSKLLAFLALLLAACSPCTLHLQHTDHPTMPWRVYETCPHWYGLPTERTCLRSATHIPMSPTPTCPEE